MPPLRFPLPLLILPALLAGGEADAGLAQRWRTSVWPLVERACVGCHDAETRKGEVDLSGLATADAALRARGLLRRTLVQVRDAQMPPAAKPQPSAAERDALLRWLGDALAAAPGGDPSTWDPGPSPVRRLTREEYERTVRDLTGLPFKAGLAGIPAESGGGAFATIGAALALPPVLMERYFAAAERIAADATDRAQAKSFALVVGAVPAAGAGADAHAQAARRVLARFARRAWRRPVADAEVAALLALHAAAAKAGRSWSEALRPALHAVLVAPDFLLRLERERPSATPWRIDDHALATRLSYFLWSTMPDDGLAALADQGRLGDAAVLAGQVKRLLADARAHALTTGFAAQWLQLERLEMARPASDQFPGFTARMRTAMRDEVESFCDALRSEDRSVLDLLDCDYAWVNADLARHYGLPAPPAGNGAAGRLVRVALTPDQHRGGLLGMGAILAMTSQAHRTSPTLRGTWVLEVLFGTPPPPPPPDAGNLTEERKGKEAASLRALLAQHAANPSCASCHRRIDPLGFALENYDAVGQWRTAHGGRPLDTSGVLPDGTTIAGLAGLKQVLHARRGEFVRNLAGQLLRYGLGRDLGDHDEAAIDAIVASSARDGHRFGALIQAIVSSQPFRYRRPTTSEASR